MVRRALLLSLLLIAPPAVAEETLASKDELMVHFREVVFLTDEGKVRNKKPLARWEGPVVARMSGPQAKLHRARVQSLFTQLSKLTGRPFSFAEPGQKANYQIKFMPTAQIRKVTGLRNARCVGNIKGRKPGILFGATVWISTDDQFRTRHCITEEITQTLGLTNDVEKGVDTIFSDTRDKRTTLSWSDQIILRTLYDSRLEPGMSADDAAPMASVIIEELMDKIRAATGG